jgi:hypothetical protein
VNFIIADSEYISLSKNKSDYNSLIKYKNQMFPEIFQFSFIDVKFSTNAKIVKKHNYYLKTKKNIPLRLKRLTNLTRNDSLKKIDINYFSQILHEHLTSKKKVTLICNGKDVQLLKLNLNKNKIRLNIKVKYVNLRKISKYVYNKTMTTSELKKAINSKIRNHDAINDCKIIYFYLCRIKKKLGLKKLNNLFSNFAQTTKI